MISKVCRWWSAALFLLFFSCGAGDDRVPPLVGGGGISIGELKSYYRGVPEMVARDLYIEGRVVSSDLNGNFRRTIVVEDDTGGIVVYADVEGYHSHFHFGGTVRLRCNSLVLDDYGGVVRIGSYIKGATDFHVEPIPSERLFEIMKWDNSSSAEHAIKKVAIPDLKPSDISRLVCIKGVQFAGSEIGRAWCEPDADTDRHIEDGDGNTLIVRTSRNASFADELLPDGSGYIEGVIGRFNGNYQLTVNARHFAVMNAPRFGSSAP